MHFEKLAYVIFIVWFFAVFLQIINMVLFRVLEGYYWPVSRMKWLRQREQRRFEKIEGPYNELNEEALRLGDGFPQKKQAKLDALRYCLVREFPSSAEELLPTRFGNAIRAFEVYSKEMYGADAIPLWLRLAAVVPREFQETIEDVRAQVNFLINTLFLALVFAAMAFGRFFINAIVPGAKLNWTYGLAAILALVLAWVIYRWSIERAQAWGDLVKSAFDCYLGALAKQLGYTLPRKGGERRKFWESVSRAAIFNQPLEPEDWEAPAKDNGSQEQRMHDRRLSSVMQRLR